MGTEPPGLFIARLVQLAFLVSLLVAPPGSVDAAVPEDVWMDVDCAIGLSRCDVDDGLALVQAVRSPELAVRGISTVFGNAPLAQGLPVTRELVSRFGPPGVPVAPGAASPADLGHETAATRAMASALSARPLTVLALGPVTNVASLLLLHPTLEPRIRRILVVAGRRPGQSFLSSPRQKVPFRDFNFELDPSAMRVLLESHVELWLAPWQVSSSVWVTPQDLRSLALRSAAGAWLWLRCQDWMRLWRSELGAVGFNPFDALAVGWVTHPSLIESRPVSVSIEEFPDDIPPPQGTRTVPVKPFLMCREQFDGRRALFAWRPAREFHELLLDRLAGASKPAGH